jgi:hypothetical protein
VWDPITGDGPQYVIESYSFTISSHSNAAYYSMNGVQSTLATTNLEYNVEFNASVFSENCAGQGKSVSITNIYFGKVISSAV